MLTIIIRTIEFCVYHLCIVIASHISKIQVHETARQRDQLLRRYLAAMTEIRILKRELVKLKGKQHSPTLKVRCAQVLSYIFTRNDKTYHDSYLSTTKATARRWAYKFRHPVRSRRKKNMGGRPKISKEIIELIITLKKNNGHWGSLRIHDELLNMGIKVSRSAISNILIENGFDPTGNSTNKWKKWEGMYKDHLWACDFCATRGRFNELFSLYIVENHLCHQVNLGA